MDPSSSSSKRPRPPSNASLVPSCLVDGCSSDLALCRDYHRRHKVCELHSKTSIVLIKGKEQRFCQQCSRFHSLGEFDEGKRSCRKRLEGHNRRRRKPQPDAYAASPVISNQTTRYIHFGGSHLYPSNYSLGGGVKSDDAPMLYDDDASTGYGTRRGGYFRDVSDSVKGASLMFGESNVDGMVRSPDGFNRVVESNCALSLLSSPNETREINLGQFSRPGINSSAHSFLSMVNYNMVGGESEPLRGSGYMPDGRTANIHGQMIQTLPDGSAPSGTHHTLSFSWE